MKYATKPLRTQVILWLIWAIACLVFLIWSEPFPSRVERPALAGALTSISQPATAFPWRPRQRLRKWAWRRYCALRRAHQKARWVAHLAHLALVGSLTLAQVVDWATHSQLRYTLGSLPVLYGLLEDLQVRPIINRHCPTHAKIDHGRVALVLILNRLSLPLPLYQVADWMAQTVLVSGLGLPTALFNDDRLGRTLSAIAPHAQAIWQEVVEQALVRGKVDLELVFYDLTAYIFHGQYEHSQLVDFGFAHNTPKKKRKLKQGLTISADGNLPLLYGLWSGRTADSATVVSNLESLSRLVQAQGRLSGKTLIAGDRANLDDRLALFYNDHQIQYVAGLRVLKTVHKEILLATPEVQFYCEPPLTQERGSKGYWGKFCQIPFEYEGRQVVQRGLVVISGPMRSALRQGRAAEFKRLRQQLQLVRSQIGQPRLRSLKSVQRRANQLLKASPAGEWMRAEAFTQPSGAVNLRWWVDGLALFKTMQSDGRYLLVTNDFSLSAAQIFARYHQKDGVEKCFLVNKQDLQVSPVYLHKDERIAAMLFINLLALLAYRLLERQIRQRGLALTTRQIIAKLESLTVIVTRCWDQSCLYRCTPADEEQMQLLLILADILRELSVPGWPTMQLPGLNLAFRSLSPPASSHPRP